MEPGGILYSGSIQPAAATCVHKFYTFHYPAGGASGSVIGREIPGEGTAERKR